MATATIKVKGLKELSRALRKVEGELDNELRGELKAAAELVSVEAGRLLMPVSPSSAEGFRPRVRVGGAYVVQSKRKTTGLHPEFGALQMRTALLPALESKEGEVVRHMEDMLDTLGRGAGF